ncbi:hypothetical protein [Amylolactobacillus amylophilus]|uniref:hypothetical protein n=1 Tax=Amylolactobacillus amylophilus TaxID=1603 RepID=UPI000AA29AA1|nr:hypothetical protein [Amylolactobacillus amylophilus]
MSKKEKIALSLGLVVLVLIFISSSMTYQQQNIQSDLQPFWPPFTRFLNSFSFVYAGEKHSLALDAMPDIWSLSCVNWPTSPHIF